MADKALSPSTGDGRILFDMHQHGALGERMVRTTTRLERWTRRGAEIRGVDPYGQFLHGLVALAVVFISGVAGYVFLCHWSISDAVYMIIITVSSVGFGEIGPRTTYDRVITSYVVLAGIMAAAYTFSGLIQMMSEGQIRRVVTRQLQSRKIENLKNHHIVCGFGRMGQMICEDLYARNEEFVLLELNTDRIALAAKAGYLFVQGDATDEAALVTAGIHRARTLVCVLPSDADNVFVTLTARDMNEKLFIAARAEKLTTEKKLTQAGADRVVAPQVIGAQRMSSLLVRPTTVEILELVTGRNSIDLEMNEVTVKPGGPEVGKTLAQAEVRARTGVIVVAIKRREGNVIVNPDSSVAIYESDTVVVLGKVENVDAFRRLYGA
ncbi:MAG: potassium channel protein [Planctomycetota bacterium]